VGPLRLSPTAACRRRKMTGRPLRHESHSAAALPFFSGRRAALAAAEATKRCAAPFGPPLPDDAGRKAPSR